MNVIKLERVTRQSSMVGDSKMTARYVFDEPWEAECFDRQGWVFDTLIGTLSLPARRRTNILNGWTPVLHFWQIEIDHYHEDKSTFTSRHGLYRFNWMRFRVKNVRAYSSEQWKPYCWVSNTHVTLSYLEGNHQSEVRLREFAPHPDSAWNTVMTWFIAQFAGDMHLLRGFHWLVGNMITPSRLKKVINASNEIQGLQYYAYMTYLTSFTALCIPFRRLACALSLHRRLVNSAAWTATIFPLWTIERDQYQGIGNAATISAAPTDIDTMKTQPMPHAWLQMEWQGSCVYITLGSIWRSGETQSLLFIFGK